MGGVGSAVTFRRVSIVCVALSVVAAAASGQTPGGTETTVGDRVYNEEQAKRGRNAYDAKCAACHDGGTMGPELWGDPFLAQWENKYVGAFFSRIQTTMPEDAPGSLSENEVLDIVAYVLRTNGFPAGNEAIQSASALATMKFVRKK
jgi:mono/diheme cytochrome c family protein